MSISCWILDGPPASPWRSCGFLVEQSERWVALLLIQNEWIDASLIEPLIELMTKPLKKPLN
jgi:hypothetical protein